MQQMRLATFTSLGFAMLWVGIEELYGVPTANTIGGALLLFIALLVMIKESIERSVK